MFNFRTRIGKPRGDDFFGILGPAMVLWVVWPLLWSTPLFGGGALGRVAVVALTAVVFGIGLAWLVQVINGFMRYASR